MDKELERQKEAYETLLDAINFRRNLLSERLNSENLPRNLQLDYAYKMGELDKLSELLFS